MKRHLWPLVIFLLLVGFLGVGLGLKPRDVPSPLVNRPMPHFSLPTLEHPERSLGPQDLRGQVYLINVWASWCTACQAEHPLLVDLARAGVVPIYGLNYKDGREDALRWLAGVSDKAEGRLDAPLAALERAIFELAEAQSGVETCLDALDFDESALERLEERLFAIRALARKHGVLPDDLGPYADVLRTRLEALDGGERGLIRLRQAAAMAEAEQLTAGGTGLLLQVVGGIAFLAASPLLLGYLPSEGLRPLAHAGFWTPLVLAIAAQIGAWRLRHVLLRQQAGELAGTAADVNGQRMRAAGLRQGVGNVFIEACLHDANAQRAAIHSSIGGIQRCAVVAKHG